MRIFAVNIISIMNTVSLNNLWSYLKGLSLTASNQRWLGEKLIEASETQTSCAKEEELKLKKLNALFGSWSGADGEKIETAVKESRSADYVALKLRTGNWMNRKYNY